MFFFEQLLYEAAPPQSIIPVPKPVTYVPPGAKEKVAQVQQQQQQDDFDFDGNFTDADLEGGEDGTLEGDISQDPNSTLVPIKRYYLIQKLFALNNKLNQLRIKNDVLNTIILFIDSFTYESLLSLSNKIVEDIYLQVKDTSTEKTT